MAWITLWARESFAERWYRDAAAQAGPGGGADERRREIVFAICLAESYLYEWVRDHIYPDDEASLLAVFPNRVKRPLIDRWKDVATELHRRGRMTVQPTFSRTGWTDLATLVDYRNGLVHAGASRPINLQTPSAVAAPVPSASTLVSMIPGWPTNTVVAEISELHRCAGTPPPAWLLPV